LQAQQISIREIGRLLERDYATISREPKRKIWTRIQYNAINTQHIAEEQKSLAGKRHPLKDNRTYEYALEKLKEGWSPEQIARREQREQMLCHEAILFMM